MPLEKEALDQEAMMKAAEVAEGGASEAKPSIVYDEYQPERPSADLLNDAEKAALADDGSADDTYDDEAVLESAPVADQDVPTLGQAPANAPPVDLAVDYAAKIAETDAKLEELAIQLDDGEIGDAEYKAQVLALAEQRGDLRASAKMADAYLDQTEAVAAAKWGDAVKGFKSTHSHLFGPDHFDKFNVDVLGVTADLRFAHLPFEQQLAKAAQDYAFRVGNPALSNAATAIRPAAAPKAAPAPMAKRVPVPTLARVSNTAAVAPDGGRFAAIDARIDAKDVMGTEDVLSRMTKAQLEAFGAGN